MKNETPKKDPESGDAFSIACHNEFPHGRYELVLQGRFNSLPSQCTSKFNKHTSRSVSVTRMSANEMKG